MTDNDLPAIIDLMMVKNSPFKPRPRTFVVCWRNGGVSIGSAIGWHLHLPWWALGKPECYPLDRYPSTKKTPLYSVRKVVDLLRSWNWPEQKLGAFKKNSDFFGAIEFNEPWEDIGFTDEESYYAWLINSAHVNSEFGKHTDTKAEQRARIERAMQIDFPGWKVPQEKK
jgi:hypothetical protein